VSAICSHPGPRTDCVCAHVDSTIAADGDIEYFIRFTGVGTELQLLCAACVEEAAPPLASLCATCRDRRVASFDVVGVRGRPEVRQRASSLRFEHATSRIAELAGATPATVAPRPRSDAWLIVANRGLVELRVDERALQPIVSLEPVDGLDWSQPLTVVPSPDGRFAAVVNTKGRYGAVVDLERRTIAMRLDRGDDEWQHSEYPAAFFTHEGRSLLVHATDWNRLDISDPTDGALLTPRTTGSRDEPHYLDYFHGGLTVSPDHRWLVDDGWVWHPIGEVRSFDVQRWRRDNVFESEDGPSVREFRHVLYNWDVPRCFVDDRTFVTWGFGPDDDFLVDAAELYDVESGERLRWFGGPPKGRFVFDGHLVVVTEAETSVWDVASGERLLEVPGFAPCAFHPELRLHLSLASDGTVTLSRLVAG
jgi:hypothetical protein